MPRLAAKLALALLIMFLALASTLWNGATPAYAHAIVVRTEPADGAVLGGPPQQVRLWFSEPIALGFTSFELVDSAGKHIAVVAHADAASAALAVRNQGASSAEVILDLPALPASVYRLSWAALSNGDLHNTSGTIVFGVQRATDGAAASAAEPAPAPAELALRWLNLGALAGLIGALALVLLVATNDERPATNDQRADKDHSASQARNRLLRLAAWSAGLAGLAGLGLLLAQAMASGAAAGQNLLAGAWSLSSGTSYGWYWLLRQTALALLIAVLVSVGRKAANFSYLQLLLSIALVLAITASQALQGHATAFAELAPLRVAADALHLLAAGIWVGGLLALAVAIVPLLRAGPQPMALAWAILRRFGALAGASLAALLISGLFMSGQQVASPDALLATLYGRALLLKIGLAAAVALIGLRNAAALHPGVAAALRWHKLRTAATRPPVAHTIMLEAAGATLLLLLAAFLGAAQPARGSAFDPPAAATQAVALAHANDLVVTLALKPNRPGQNFVALSVLDTRRPAPAPIDHVSILLQPPGAPAVRLVASPLGKGRYQASDDSIAGAGDMHISVTIQRPGLPDAAAVLPWTVLPAAQQPRAVLVSNQPLAPWLNAAAIVLALLLVLALIGLQLHRCMSSPATSLTSIISGAAGTWLRPLRKD